MMQNLRNLLYQRWISFCTDGQKVVCRTEAVIPIEIEYFSRALSYKPTLRKNPLMQMRKDVMLVVHLMTRLVIVPSAHFWRVRPESSTRGTMPHLGPPWVAWHAGLVEKMEVSVCPDFEVSSLLWYCPRLTASVFFLGAQSSRQCEYSVRFVIESVCAENRAQMCCTKKSFIKMPSWDCNAIFVTEFFFPDVKKIPTPSQINRA